MAKSILKAKKRSTLGKRSTKSLRREGNIPAVIYSKGNEAVPLELNPKDVKNAFATDAGRNTLIEMEIEGEDNKEHTLSILRDMQMDYLTNTALHLDFLELDMNEKIEVKVPLVFTGRAQGVKEGGILEEMIREISVVCVPADIPDNIEHDVTELELEMGVQIKDLALPDGAEAIGNPDDTVAMVHVPRAMIVEEPTVAEGEEGEEGAEGVEGAEGEETADAGEKAEGSDGGSKSEG